jgi:RHS repeat-associated protein
MGRLARVDLPDGENRSYSYTAAGQVQSLVDRRGATAFTYDSRDRVTKVSNPDGSQLGYGYDPRGNRSSFTTPAGITRYGYDAGNRLIDLTDPRGRQTAFSYDAVGNPTKMAHPNGVTAEANYDLRNRLTGIKQERNGATLRSYVYMLDPVGNRTSVTEDTGRAVTYGYDPLSRLTQEVISAPGSGDQAFAYSYDATGNRLSKDGPTGATSYAYDANSRLTSMTEPAGRNTTFGYDDNGNMLSKSDPSGTTSLEYNGADRLTAVTSPTGAVTQYSYDGFDNRIAKTDPSGTVNYLIDPLGTAGLSETVRESDSSGAVLADYTYANGQLISKDRSTGPSFVLSDAQQSTRLLTDASGNITDRYDYDAFGNLLSRSGATPNNYLFNGQEFDGSLNAYNLRARNYDPSLGRFLSRDPFPGFSSDPSSLNPYSYAHNNPINRFDPTGQFTIGEYAATLAISGALYGAITGGIRGGLVGAVKGAIVGALVAVIAGFVLLEASYVIAGVLGGLGASGVTAGGVFWTVNTGGALYGLYRGLDQYRSASTQEDRSIAIANIVFSLVGLGFSGKTIARSGPGGLPVPPRPTAGLSRSPTAVVGEGKFGYLFGEVTSNEHNAARSAQNLAQMQRLGVPNTPSGRALLQEHFNAVVQDRSNIVSQYSNQYGSFQVRESLFAGPSGAFAKFETTWQVMPDGSLRLTTVIPLGGR